MIQYFNVYKDFMERNIFQNKLLLFLLIKYFNSVNYFNCVNTIFTMTLATIISLIARKTVGKK